MPGWQNLGREFHGFLQLFLPAVCLLCQERLPDGHPADRFCPVCLDALPKPAPARCPCCAMAHRTPVPSLHHCAACLRDPPPFFRVHALGPYQGNLRAAVHRFKFREGLILERPLGCLLADTVRAGFQGGRPDLLIPVPLHPDRLRRRGYNQALQLARQVARQCSLPLAPAGLRRLRETTPQQSLDARFRRTNLHGAFSAAGEVTGCHVLLIDDVMTTGATARECADALRRAGAAAVEVAVLGRA